MTRNAEERQLVADMTRAGKSRKEIEDALDALRKSRGELGEIDSPANPDEWLKRGWIETTRPEAAAKGHRSFINPKTREELRFDRGKPNETGARAKDHYHRIIRDENGRERYYDRYGNPVKRGSDKSHIMVEDGS